MNIYEMMQQDIWDNEKLQAQVSGLCIGGCNWLNTDEVTGAMTCVSNTGCMYVKGGV